MQSDEELATDPPAEGAVEMTDAHIDAHLPAAARRASRIFWTQVETARRAAALFQDLGVRRVLDIGSGPGKFCVVASASAPNIAFVGVEHRPALVAAARALALVTPGSTATFVGGDATRIPWVGFDGFFVYNSFAENDFPAHLQFDQTVELSHRRHLAEAKRMMNRLAATPEGTVLMTHHGLSGPVPGSFALIHTEKTYSGWLRVWRQGPPSSRDKFWLEEGGEITSWDKRSRR